MIGALQRLDDAWLKALDTFIHHVIEPRIP
jgi:hypothetical protein